jgi:K+-transporting ATPase ATPase C chain
VPAELVTTSASGFDPHLSPDAARWQIARVAGARGVRVDDVGGLVDARTEERTFGFLGEPRVNVLRLNLDLDDRFGPPEAQAPAATPASQGAAR